MSTNQIIYLVVAILIVLFFFILIFLVIDKIRKKGRIIRALNMGLFLVKLPRESKADIPADEKKARIAVMEQFLSGLNSIMEKSSIKRFLYGRPYIVFEMAVPFSTAEISFYLATPKKYYKFLEKQIYGFYPKAVVEKVDDYNIFICL